MGICETLGEDSRGLCEDSQDFGMRIHETLGEDSWGFMRICKTLGEDS